ncbi:ABC transporter ATP-binding protein [Aquisalimonas asiatica]|uniref:ABC-type dipeptide transporter n=1 Tax=Aquisalimonas asiatica TaxID=406100 RepID=A0A1H8S4I1_9GAMM|nr:ABC transporter ATP-binding protein [Aquisalimonas asiatica]SEO73545.1 oligopeptide/dipeptide ABC transporter, ATP-binding protein, C-terminal domain-containing protein [Aquisalimonas asiatica]
MNTPLLKVSNLTVDFKTRSGQVHALENVGYSVNKGEMVAVVGESGSGKSVSAFAVMGLLDAAAQIRSGDIRFDQMDLLSMREEELAQLRGREMAMIFQNPASALNPIRKVGQQIEDVLRRHGPVSSQDARERAIAALAQVRIPAPERRYDAYPFQLSGGLCQRVMIAMALCCHPRLLIADEPTTGLDVTTQATVMDLLASLGSERDMGTLLITHDLALASQYADRVIVMHAGQIVESAETRTLLESPRHPYTAGLVEAAPGAARGIEELRAIPGGIPDLRGDLPPCRFAGRCNRHLASCDDPGPTLEQVTPDHWVACRRPL